MQRGSKPLDGKNLSEGDILMGNCLIINLSFRHKLKCEILARNELNAKLAEVNAWLETRASEQANSERNRDEVS